MIFVRSVIRFRPVIRFGSTSLFVRTWFGSGNYDVYFLIGVIVSSCLGCCLAPASVRSLHLEYGFADPTTATSPSPVSAASLMVSAVQADHAVLTITVNHAVSQRRGRIHVAELVIV